MIDDDESVCRSLSRLLQNASLYPITYLSAEEFLDDRMRVPFCCLIVDIQLTGMSGIELARRLKACRIALPVIYITANDDPETRAAALESGPLAYFRKSVPGTELLAVIGTAIRAGSAT